MGFGARPAWKHRGMGSRRVVLIACVVAATGTLLGGCGREGARDAVRQTAERFYGAVQAKDGAKACAALEADTREQLEKEEMKPCDEAVLAVELQGGPATRAKVWETSAEVHLAGGDTVFLDETDDGWRVSAAGCKPTTEQEPYDCELAS